MVVDWRWRGARGAVKQSKGSEILNVSDPFFSMRGRPPADRPPEGAMDEQTGFGL